MNFDNFSFKEMEFGNVGFEPARLENIRLEGNMPLVDFDFACQHKFECGSSWPYIMCGEMSESDMEAYKKWRAAHSKK